MAKATKLIDRRRVPIFIHGELDDMGLHPESFRVYAHLVRRADKTGASFPGLQEIGDTCFPNYEHPDTRKKHAISAIKDLISRGLVTKETRHRNGFTTSNAYVIQEVTAQPVWPEVTEEETPAPKQSVAERSEWREALMPILWQHSSIKLMTAGHHRQVKDLATKFTAAGVTVQDLLDWYQKEWRTNHWKGKKGDAPLPNEVMAGVAAWVENKTKRQAERVTIVAAEDDDEY